MTGSPLYQRMLAFDYGDVELGDLMRKVWSGTPWILEVWTGSPDDDESLAIMNWCRDRWGGEALPIHGHPGAWYRGSATVNGWTWFGFLTEAMMREFAKRWRVRCDNEMKI